MSHPAASSSRVEQLACPTCRCDVLAVVCFAGRCRTPRAECPWCGSMLTVEPPEWFRVMARAALGGERRSP